ncbi:MAG: GGDEF domain-containing protein [Planctomyces sp.]|nr:GGDEF domain-containing protein [Planctomyces sp.]
MFVDFTKLNRLPSLPTVAVQLLERFSNPDVALAEIVAIVRTDPAITAKLMRAANSALYGVGRPVTDLNRAVSLLGKKTVTSLALCFSLSEESMGRGHFSALYRGVWLQSVLQAITAEIVARRYDRGREGEYFAIALLADIGRLAMLKSAPQEYAAIVERCGREQLDVEACEDEAFGINHTALSIALLEHWNLPKHFCGAVRQRHAAPVDLLGQPAGEQRRLSHAVALATSVGNYFCHGSRGLSLARTCELAAELYSMTPDQARELLESVQQRVRGSAELFDTDISRLGTPTELMSEAMEQLTNLATAACAGECESRIRHELLDENGQLKQRVRDLMRRKNLDALTGIINRGHFDELLSDRAAQAAAHNQPLGLLFIDADHFKAINDTHGHPAGDLVLKRLAALLSSDVRPSDVLARYGGEEFVVLVHDPSQELLESLGERLRAAVEHERFDGDRGGLKVTVSIGGAVVEPPHDEDSLPRLLALADSALYAVKDGGRNGVDIRCFNRHALQTAALELAGEH